MPPRVTRPDYDATQESPDDLPAAGSAGSVVTAAFGSAHPSAKTAGVKSAAHTTAAHTATHASAAGSSAAMGAAAAIGAPRSRSRTIALAVGLGAILVIGIGLIVALPGSSDQAMSTSRPTEAVHVKSNETARPKQPDTASVPTPQGTARRMEEINKAFSKR
jgi:hypothetical protein